MARNHKLLLAMSIAVAAVGFFGLVKNIRALLDSDIEPSSLVAAPPADEVGERKISVEAHPTQTPMAAASPASSPLANKRGLSHSGFSHSREELNQLVKKSAQEAKVCRANVSKARSKLSKTLMSAEEFKGALSLLEQTYLTPPSSQKIYLAFEEGSPTQWDGSSLLDEAISAGGCDTVIHYKLLKSVVEKAAQHPERFPREQIRAASRAFLFTGAESPSPLSTELLRVALLKDLVQAKEIDSSYESKVSELDSIARGLMDKIQEDLRDCQNAPDCLKLLPNEFEQSKRVRESYLKLLKEIWPG